ncbi:MAG: DUF2281 domain-containing protein [Nodosilinea sp.]
MATITLREQILAELDQVPDAALAEILAYLQARKSAAVAPGESAPAESAPGEPAPKESTLEESAIWQAYLKSEKERAEVYRHLANS